MQLDTVTFWHKPIEGGAPVASSCVGAAPMDVQAAHALAVQQTGYGPATGMNRMLLTFPPPASFDPAVEVRRVMGAYHGCARCHLCASRMSIVHGRGNPEAAVVILGEGPGKDENDLGEPFVGRSGKLQDEMFRQVGIDPGPAPTGQLFWMNIVGCRPAAKWEPEDRAPTDPEMLACAERTYLLLQAVRPRVVICLGKVATRYFFDEPPPVWNFTKFTPAGAPDDWVQIGYAHHPAYLARVVGAPTMYKEYAAQRTFYANLRQRMAGLTKVNRWHFLPRYLSAAILGSTLVAWPGGSSGGAVTSPGGGAEE